MTFNSESTTDEVIAGIDLHGKTAVVTGASAGLDIETAKTLAGAGARSTASLLLTRFAQLRLLINNVAVMACLLLSAPLLRAESGPVIDAKAQQAIATFRAETAEGARLMDQAAGVLVFPDVVQMNFGIGIGGEYGEGNLLIAGDSVAYYATVGTSFGAQVGLQFKALMLLFMTNSELANFRRHSNGWEAGVHGEIALATVDASGSIAADTANKPIIGFVFSNKGLMYNLSLEGNRISRLKR